MVFEKYPLVRELDGVYVRAERDGKWCNRCFTDLPAEEQQTVLDSLDIKGLQRMCLIMSGLLRKVGDQFDIFSIDPEDEDNG